MSVAYPGFKPMLAGKYDHTRVQFPCYIQPKFDGIRCTVLGGVGFSRTLKPLPNSHIQNWIAAHAEYLEGLDGEMIVGQPTDVDVYRKTMSGVMSGGGTPDFKFYVFDYVNPHTPFSTRRQDVERRFELIWGTTRGELKERACQVITLPALSHEEVVKIESGYLELGYEGAILRSAHGNYKYGRATSISGELLKLKRFVDEEAQIIGFEELMSNQNEAVQDALGHTKRSSHLSGKVPANTLGAFIVQNAKGQQYNVGMGQGLDQVLRKRVWENRESYLGRHIIVRYVSVGNYDVPRFPGYHGFRDPIDMGTPT